MRALACTILTIATVLVAAPARAQTYDPNYPVCLHTYGPSSNWRVAAHRPAAVSEPPVRHNGKQQSFDHR